MRRQDGQIRLSASDLANHLACRHLTNLNRAAAEGRTRAPEWNDPLLEILQQRGLEHEQQYVERLRQSGAASVECIGDSDDVATALEKTRLAMRRGVDVIVQATLAHGRWFGRADILHRVPRPSALGPWSYEVTDTKLTHETRGGTILQLCLYSDLLKETQGTAPERGYVVAPKDEQPEAFRLLDFTAYYRLVRQKLELALAAEDYKTYPEPVEHCDICRWWTMCDQSRRGDDHLSLVAGIRASQRVELHEWGVNTLAALAKLQLPLTRKPLRGAADSYVRVHDQARLQLARREDGTPRYEMLPVEDGRGLTLLPEPTGGDIFLDFEGDPFAGNSGLEYLFGFVTLEADQPKYTSLWATTLDQERLVFEMFVSFVMARWKQHPKMHVFHYAPYEPSALKRLSCRHGVCAEEVDQILRAGLFIDLYTVVRQALRASVEKYSIKDLEEFFAFRRTVDLRDASTNLRVMEHTLERGRPEDISESVRKAIRGYNKDDCLAALHLRGWLEKLRSEAEADGATIARPAESNPEPRKDVSERQQRTLDLAHKLTHDIPSAFDERFPDRRARWLLAHLLDWHQRERKAPWWEYFRLRELSEEEQLDERFAISGMVFVERVGGTAKCPIDRYRFPAQECGIEPDDEVHTADLYGLATVEAVDLRQCTVDLKKKSKFAESHPTAVFAHSVVNTQVLENAVFALGEWVAKNGIDAEGPFRAARDLLLRLPPRLPSEKTGPLRKEKEATEAAARRLITALDGGVLPVQGPPGAGKTYVGARMICELVRVKKRVGVTAASHKVIENLLSEVVVAAEKENLSVRCARKVSGPSKGADSKVREFTDNKTLAEALAKGECQVAGGTPWFWARPDLQGAVDVLIVDEAGQLSLANTLAVAQAARSLVLLGDPQQLEQPQQGTHPEGADASALGHLLGGNLTVPEDRGLFLGETHRLHPSICAFTSELFYESRLRSHAGLEIQHLANETQFTGSGLFFVPVEHAGNQSDAPEEVDAVDWICRTLLASESRWTDRKGAEHPLTTDDILIVAPYNAQVSAIRSRIGTGRVGTVDKFQGQEAPVVIVSMTTSSPEDAPHGMEFLYSGNRLNVATSRAKCICILVASPRLFEPDCKTPRQMKLSNAYCRYLEMARLVANPRHSAAAAQRSTH